MAGSLEKRPNNKWLLVVPGGTGPGGKRIKHKKTVEATSEREARKLLDQFSAEVQKGEYVAPSKMTFAQFTERWLKNHAEVQLSPKTLFRYKQILESRVLPAMGHLQVEQIKPVHLMEFYSNLREAGGRMDGKPGKLSEKTILYHHRVISSILSSAVEWQVINSNPAARVKPPKVTKKQAPCYDESQIVAMLEALETEELKYQVIVQVALFSGQRRGEILGLEWRHIDFKEGTLTVEQASQYLPDRGVFVKPPKNESSKRLLSLPPFLLDLLRRYRKEQAEGRMLVGDAWQGTDRIFTTWDGRPMHPDTVSSWFPQFLERHGLPHLTFHGLRHSSATMSINEGLPAKSISGRLGHSSIGITMDLYGHYLQSADKVMADKLEQVYQRMKNNSKGDAKKGRA